MEVGKVEGIVGTHVCFYYIKKARSCEQALGVVCGKVASEKEKYEKFINLFLKMN